VELLRKGRVWVEDEGDGLLRWCCERKNKWPGLGDCERKKKREEEMGLRDCKRKKKWPGLEDCERKKKMEEKMGLRDCKRKKKRVAEMRGERMSFFKH
jgi:hypothetical protein